MNIDIFTLFPDWFDWFARQRHVSNALANGSSVECFDIRRDTPLSAGQVDDTPYGGGAGMVMRVDVLDAALRARYGCDPVELRTRRRVIALGPAGRLLDERYVCELAAEPELTLLCGRYEGFDERIVEHFASESLSIGRYVLSGGELAAMVLCDALLRKLPGSLGDEGSAIEESYSEALDGLPEYPHYTRPAEYRGWRVPDVLLSGHHERIRSWRHERSTERGAAERGVAERGVAERGVAERGAAERGVAERGVAERGVAERGAAERGAAEPGVLERGVAGHDAIERGPVACDTAERRAEGDAASRPNTDVGAARSDAPSR